MGLVGHTNLIVMTFQVAQIGRNYRVAFPSSSAELIIEQSVTSPCNSKQHVEGCCGVPPIRPD